ncbi:MAG: hypothetical protein LBQ30_08565 [Treponema sp.]|jgi:hypothetical protein|nr:hypothetical protein [Treponema sp.]
MGKIDTETKATEPEDKKNKPETSKNIKVLFKNTYIGKHGIFYKKNRYTISTELAEIMKNDLQVLEQ